MTRIALCFSLVSLLSTLPVTGAFAQQAPPGTSGQTGNPRQDARVHIGPFYLTPAILIDRLGVDTNVFNAAGEQQSDFVFGLAPQVTVWLPIYQRAMITTKLSTGVTYYQKFADQRSLAPGVNVAGELKLGPLTPFGDISYSQSKSRPNSEIDVRVPVTSVGGSLGLSYQLRPRLKLELSARRGGSHYGNDADFLGFSLKERLNSRQQGVQFKVDQRLTSLTTVYVSAGNVQDKFEFSPDRDAAGVRVAAGFGFGLRALINGQAEIGFRSMDPVNAAIPSFRGLVAAVGLGYKARGATALHVDWNRDVQFSYQVLHPYYVMNRTLFTARRQLAGRFDGIAGLGRNVSSYVRLSTDTERAHAVTKTFSLDIGYRLNRDARLGFAITRDWRTSKPSAGREYSGIRAGLSFSVGF